MNPYNLSSPRPTTEGAQSIPDRPGLLKLVSRLRLGQRKPAISSCTSPLHISLLLAHEFRNAEMFTEDKSWAIM